VAVQLKGACAHDSLQCQWGVRQDILRRLQRCNVAVPVPPHPTSPKDNCISILTGQLLLLRPSVRRAVLRLSARGLRAWIGEWGKWWPESRPPGLVRLQGAWPRAWVSVSLCMGVVVA
jgi:hypothetical protein